MAERERRRSVEKERQWRRAIREQGKSGLSIRDYCREHDLAENSFYFWRGELARRDAQKPVATPKTAPLPPVPGFAAVTVVEPQTYASAVIEIELGAEVRVRLFPGFDATAVRDILAALRSHSC